jgi:mannosyltransferase OCH1-like enzyme
VIPKIIHQIWLGDKPMPKQHWRWRMELAAMNLDWEIKLWDDNSLTAEGLMLGNLYKPYWSHASVSNFVRLWIVERYGGVYLDTDMEPLKPIDPLVELGSVLNLAVACDQGDGRICNAFFAAPPNNEWVKWQRKHGAMDCDPHDAAWGVYTMTKAPRDGLCLIPTASVYPFHYSVPKENRKVSEHSILAHHWEGSWQKK